MIEIPNSKKIQMRYSFYIVLILIIMIPQYAFAVENNQDIAVKEENGIIYLIDNTKSKKALVHGYDPLLSNNKTKFIYAPYAPRYPMTLDIASVGVFYVYNITTRENKFIYEEKSGQPFFYEMWSPYDRYIVFDGGTSNLLTKYVFDTVKNKFIIDFPTFDEMYPYEWNGEDEIIYWDSSDYLGSSTKIRKQKIINMKTLEIKDYMTFERDKNGNYKIIK